MIQVRINGKYAILNGRLHGRGVNSMQNYIRYNTGLGPNGVFVSSASSLLTGDMVHIDWDNDGSYNHAVAIYIPGASPTDFRAY